MSLLKVARLRRRVAEMEAELKRISEVADDLSRRRTDVEERRTWRAVYGLCLRGLGTISEKDDGWTPRMGESKAERRRRRRERRERKRK